MSVRILLGRAGAHSLRSLSASASARMPLRAKILDPRVASQASSQFSTTMSTKNEYPTWPDGQMQDDDPEDVRFSSNLGLRMIQLNRLTKLNSLNASMIRKIAPRLIEWEKSDLANVVVIKGAGDRAFCAGGDVKEVAKRNAKGPEGRKQALHYFEMEYRLDHYIATYNKPYIAFMDGITMGGGVGLSIHAPFRIATEKTVFAMPETTIGFFPDVGASFFMPRMNGVLGKYLALTSDRVKGANVFYTGLATHYLHSTSLPALESRLAELRFKDYDDMEMRLRTIEMTIEEFATGLPPLEREPFEFSGGLRKAIDRCFNADTVSQIMLLLEHERNGPYREWAEKTKATLHERSPTSVHVTNRLMNESGYWDIANAFKREYRMAGAFLAKPDFAVGVAAQLSKPRLTPEWNPAKLDDIGLMDRITEPFFSPDAVSEDLELLTERTYSEYPLGFVGVPTERDVRAYVEDQPRKHREVVEHFVRERRGRQGIKMIVEEILGRNTFKDVEGIAAWDPEMFLRP